MSVRRKFIAQAIAIVSLASVTLVGCNTPAPRLSDAQQAEQERRYDVVVDQMVEILKGANRCLTKDEMQAQIEGITSSRQEALVVTVIAGRRGAERGVLTVGAQEPYFYGLPEFGECA